ncbi:formylglycine-generating enzyme family protein [Polyangium jinanense]|uniref:Formylglycine-generating enzyme family protein n=1 Tax=Polyangium jinanense TaxID=2829994 RepID=A0A9X3X928_9BACT|nr:formylglycine-generating enzyme family protein [Polyangium jinanense]MDC3956732.1 formylglycine-generating enzyme family protein [Polyangium jinanense]MDC3984795.1 formylglycine-generating enzyme family protein [Polyangium jinanense]
MASRLLSSAAALLLGAAACSSPDASPAPTPPASAASPPPAPTPLPSAAPPPEPSRCAGVTCASIERCDEATGACVPHCPAGEVYIPKTGPDGFVMGKGFTLNGGARRLRKGHQPDSDRPHRVVLTRPFCMDETEVTVAAMKPCVDEKTCDPPKTLEVFANYPRRPDHPANEVSWDKAKKYCKAQGKDLPTEAQWEWAATGGDGRKWPWGNDEPTCEHADFTIGVLVSPGGDSGCHGGGTSPVRSHPKGARSWPTGTLHDLAGNVWEWCDDTYAKYGADAVTDPHVQKPGVLVHVVRGGGWNRSNLGIQTAFRGAAIHTYEVPGLGFRCVRNP